MSPFDLLAPAKHKALKDKISKKTARIGIIGLGYTGLPLAVEFAKSGYSVTGLDTEEVRVHGINRGQSHLTNQDDGSLKSLVESGRLSASIDFSTVADLDVAIICVPTPLKESREPDLSYVESATKLIAEHFGAGRLVVLESTTYPGTTVEIVQERLESTTGLRAGNDFFLGYSPERIDPGNPEYDLKKIPKIVSGSSRSCRDLVECLYGQIVDVVPVSSTNTAELAKLFENIFRNVNIALVNELAQICDRLSINVWEVIEAASTKPFGFMKFQPGPGIGGHCIPVDPFYLSWKAGNHEFYTKFIELAGEINENMPRFVVDKIAGALSSQNKQVKGARILLVGAAYKKDISDTRESPVYKLIDLLVKEGAVTSYHDDQVPVLKLGRHELISEPLTDSILQASDCVVIVTDHSRVDYARIAEKAALIVDTRNAMHQINAEHIFTL